MRAVRRVLIGGAAGFALAGAIAAFIPWQASTLLGWDTAALIFVAWVWATIYPMSSDVTAKHAVREDSSRAVADSIVIVAAIACLAAVGLILVAAASSRGGTKAFLIGVAVLSVISSWAAVHTTFTLHYARNYFSGTEGGVDFNEKERPDYRDFAYLAFTIGMTFQVSDTDLTSKQMRRTALRHALISYLFGAVIIGLVINVVASLLH